MLKNTACITYNNPTHKRFQEEFEALYHNNFKIYNAYDREWIEKTDFFKNNKRMFSYEKYAGYFLWKPYCIKTAFNTFFTDWVLYCDSNLRFLNFDKFERLFNDLMYDQGIFLIKHRNYINKDWTKFDTFYLMDADEPKYWNANQVWSVILGFTRAKRSQEILDDYLDYCRNDVLVTEVPSVFGENKPGFVAHRWEQSVLSILVERYDVSRWLWDVDTLDTVEKVYDTELLAYKKQIDEKEMKWNI